MLKIVLLSPVPTHTIPCSMRMGLHTIPCSMRMGLSITYNTMHENGGMGALVKAGGGGGGGGQNECWVSFKNSGCEGGEAHRRVVFFWGGGGGGAEIAESDDLGAEGNYATFHKGN